MGNNIKMLKVSRSKRDRGLVNRSTTKVIIDDYAINLIIKRCGSSFIPMIIKNRDLIIYEILNTLESKGIIESDDEYKFQEYNLKEVFEKTSKWTIYDVDIYLGTVNLKLGHKFPFSHVGSLELNKSIELSETSDRMFLINKIVHNGNHLFLIVTSID